MSSLKRPRDADDQLGAGVVQQRRETHANNMNRYPTLTHELTTVVEPGPKIWLVDGETIAAQTCRLSRSPSPDPILYDSRPPLMGTSNQPSSSTVEATYHLVPLDQFCDAILGPSPELARCPSYAEGEESENTLVVPKEYLEAFHEYNVSLDLAKDGSIPELLLAQLINSALGELPSPSLRCYTRTTEGLQEPNDLPTTVMGFSYKELDSCLPNGSSTLDPIVVAVDFQSTLIVDDIEEDEGDIQPPCPPRRDFAAEYNLPRHASHLQSYARNIASSGARRHVLGILVQGIWLSFYVFDPSGGAYTSSLNLLSDSKKVIDVLKRIASCDTVRLGLDPAFVSDDMRSHTALASLAGSRTTIGGQRVTLTKQLYVRSEEAGWGMTVLEATCQLDAGSDVGGRQRSFRCCPLPDKALVKIHWRVASFDDPYQPIGRSASSLGTGNLRISELRSRLSRGFRKEMGLGYYEDYCDMEQWVELVAPNTTLVNFENFQANFIDSEKYASVCDS